MLFTNDELAHKLQRDPDTINTDTADLLRELVETEIRLVVGDARYEATAEAKFKPTALAWASRAYINPDGYRSDQASLDDYSRMVTYATETVQPAEFTASEERKLRKAAGLKSVFTIVPTSPPVTCPPRRIFPPVQEY